MAQFNSLQMTKHMPKKNGFLDQREHGLQFSEKKTCSSRFLLLFNVLRKNLNFCRPENTGPK